MGIHMERIKEKQQPQLTSSEWVWGIPRATKVPD